MNMLALTRDEEYEQIYYEAREVLYRRGKELGKPVRSDDSLRRCPVDNALLTDRELLREAWGVVLSEEILSEYVRQELPCTDCDRLWREYSQATRYYLGLVTGHVSAENKHEVIELAQLAPMVKQASETRQKSRHAVLSHGAEHSLHAA
jgi:hypothetical protein